MATIENDPKVNLLQTLNQAAGSDKKREESLDATRNRNRLNHTTKPHHLKTQTLEQSRNQTDDLRSKASEMRASITYEESTQAKGEKKPLDNCVTKFAFATKTGYSPNNPYKVNQDSFLALPHLGEYRRTHLFSVCDGHGQFGKEVSDFIKRH